MSGDLRVNGPGSQAFGLLAPVGEPGVRPQEERPPEPPAPPSLALGARIARAWRRASSVFARAPQDDARPKDEEKQAAGPVMPAAPLPVGEGDGRIAAILERMANLDQPGANRDAAVGTLKRIFTLAPKPAPKDMQFDTLKKYLLIIFKRDPEIKDFIKEWQKFDGNYPMLEERLMLRGRCKLPGGSEVDTLPNMDTLTEHLKEVILENYHLPEGECAPAIYDLLTALELTGCSLKHVLHIATTLVVDAHPHRLKEFPGARSLIAEVLKRMFVRGQECDLTTQDFRGQQTFLQYYQFNPLTLNNSRAPNAIVAQAHQDIMAMLSLPKIAKGAPLQ